MYIFFKKSQKVIAFKTLFEDGSWIFNMPGFEIWEFWEGMLSA